MSYVLLIFGVLGFLMLMRALMDIADRLEENNKLQEKILNELVIQSIQNSPSDDI